MNKVEELRARLDYLNKMYYINDTSVVTDAEYDELEREYERLTGKKYYSNHVPGGVSKVLEPVQHRYDVKSLDKINTEEELRKELHKLNHGVIQLKYDGLTLVDDNTGDERVLATRGGGSVGENVTHNARFVVRDVKKSEYPVRMEVFITIGNFEKLNEMRVSRGEEPYKNRRNCASGLIRQKDTDSTALELLDYVAYSVLGSDMTASEQVEYVRKLGYKVPEIAHTWYFSRTKIDETVELVQGFETIRNGLPFDIDGLVIKSDMKGSLEYFGSTAHHDNNEVAYKFISQGAWTVCEDVVWTVGRTGKVVPNARLKPVELLDTTVTKASLHNASYLNKMRISKGCEVYVVKCNDVIPGVVESRGYEEENKFGILVTCPECGSTLIPKFSIEDDTIFQMYCVDPQCPSKLVLRIDNMANKNALDVRGLSVETAIKICALPKVNSPSDVFNLTVEDIMKLEGFQRPSATKLYNAIQDRRKVELSRFLISGGVPMIGKSNAELLRDEFDTYEQIKSDIQSGCKKISCIPGFGDRMIKSLEEYCYLWDDLRTVIEPYKESVEVPDVGMQFTFVVTGTLSKNRKHFEDLIKSKGHKVTSSVTKKTTYLLAGEKAGSKLDKAKEIGVSIIDEDQLQDILNP